MERLTKSPRIRSGHTRGLVETELGSDGKPVCIGSADATNPIPNCTTFHNWFNPTPGITLAIRSTLTLFERTPGIFSFDDASFFPIDGQGWVCRCQS